MVVDPGFEPERVTRCSSAAGKRPVAVLPRTRTSTTSTRRARSAGDDAARLRPRGRRRRVPRPGAVERRASRTRSSEVKDLRTVVDGDVLDVRRLPDRGACTRPGTRPGSCCFRTDAFVLSGDLVFAGSIGRSRLPELVARRHGARACAGSSSCPTSCRCCPATARRPPWAASARRTRSCGASPDGARAAARDAGPAAAARRRDARAVRGRAPARPSCSGSATSRRPTFEHTELFARTSGETSDVVTKEMYTFEDKGGRSLTLRPESTASVVRAYLTHAQELPNPFKAYYVGVGVPPRASAGRAAARVPAVRHRGDRRRGRRRPTSRSSRSASGYLRERGLRALRPAPELDRRRGLPARVPRACSSPTSSRIATGSTRTAGPAWRRTRCGCSTARWTAARTSCWPRRRSPTTCATRAPRTSRRCAAGLDEAGVAYVLDPRLVRGLDYYTRTAFEWVSSALTSDAGVHDQRGRPVRRAGGGARRPADAGRRVRDGAGPRPAGDRRRGAPQPPGAAGPRASSWRSGRRGRRRPAALIARAARRRASRPTRRYEERPLKAQLKMADRAGAAFVAILGRARAGGGPSRCAGWSTACRSGAAGGRRRVADPARRMGGLR